VDGVIVLAPVADFKKGHAGTVYFQNSLTGLFENGNRVNRGTGTEVIDASHSLDDSSLRMFTGIYGITPVKPVSKRLLPVT
jgi:hypothetical protein